MVLDEARTESDRTTIHGNVLHRSRARPIGGGCWIVAVSWPWRAFRLLECAIFMKPCSLPIVFVQSP